MKRSKSFATGKSIVPSTSSTRSHHSRGSTQPIDQGPINVTQVELNGSDNNIGLLIQETEWEKVQKLRIMDFSSNMYAYVLTKLRRSLTCVEFVGITSFSNIHLILKHSHNLVRLMFQNVRIPKFNSFERFPSIPLHQLRELFFVDNAELTQDEQQILNFFLLRTNFQALTTLAFDRSTKRQMGPTSFIARSLDPPVNNFTNNLWKFFSAVSNSLKVLRIQRDGVAIINVSKAYFPAGVNRTSRLLNLQLEQVASTPTTVGLERLLLDQRSLCIAKFQNSVPTELPIRVYLSICEALRKCDTCLQDVVLQIRCISPDKDEFKPAAHSLLKTKLHPGFKLWIIELDLSTFKYGGTLKKLNIDISHGFSQARSKVSPLGELKFLELLPPTLETVLLRFDIMQTISVEVCNKLQMMRSLKFFILHGNPMYPFDVDTNCVEVLLRLPLINIFEFHHCEINSDVINTIKLGVKSLDKKLIVTPVSCAYRKYPEVMTAKS